MRIEYVYAGVEMFPLKVVFPIVGINIANYIFLWISVTSSVVGTRGIYISTPFLRQNVLHFNLKYQGFLCASTGNMMRLKTEFLCKNGTIYQFFGGDEYNKF